jgi:DNA helicase IV
LARSDFAEEAQFVRQAYQTLDRLKAKLEGEIKEALALPKGGTHQSRLERDIYVEGTLKRLAQLDIGDHALVFGRIDFNELSGTGGSYHIGRLSLSDEGGDPMVVDWRAPVAEGFYRATARDPMGLSGRWHLAIADRELTRLEYEPLDSVSGESLPPAALLAALERPRSREMSDMVATIQAEQDELIRRPISRVLVVEGSPGTGKTAVALHRAAYLAYTYRWRFERQGMLVVGPSPSFVAYVSSVLPSLGESGVEVRSFAGIRPVKRLRSEDDSRAAKVKGDLRMVKVLRKAIRDRERPLRDPVEVPFGAKVLVIDRELSKRAVEFARRQKGPHNRKAVLVEQQLAMALARNYQKKSRTNDVYAGTNVVPLFEDQMIGAIDPDETEEEVLADLAGQLRKTTQFRRAMARIWPKLTAEQALCDLFSYKALLRSAASKVLSDDEIDVVWWQKPAEPDVAEFAPSDTALLDELDVLLDGEAPQRHAHLVVDEAQDLSPMAARSLARRVSGSSITLLGDLAQATGPFAEREWDQILAPMGIKTFDKVTLSLNYRSPRGIAEVAARLRSLLRQRSRSEGLLRESAGEVTREVVPASQLISRCCFWVEHELAAVEGSVAVVLPAGLLRLSPGGIDAICNFSRNSNRVWMSDVYGVKGMEFDSVVIANAGSLGDGADLVRSLYVGVTRATQHLRLLFADSIPEILESVF